MADIVPVLYGAVSALEAVRVDPQVSTYHRNSATTLVEGLRGHIEIYRAQPETVPAPAETIQACALILQALAVSDFGSALSYGNAIMSSLPGPGQSGRKWPRPR